MNAITVKVTKYSGRKFYVMYWEDPLTRKRCYESTKRTTRSKAERVAAVREAELLEGRYKPATNTTWQEFRERYEDEVLTSLAERTDKAVGTVFNKVEALVHPQKLSDLNADRLSEYQSGLRKAELAEATIRTYLAHLRSALRWAVDMGMLREVPKVKMPKRARGSKMMKGRPITTEEFERLLSKTESVVGAAAAQSWQHFLTGLWWSGLRLSEGLDLWWDRQDKLRVDMDGRRPMLWIRADLEKGNQDRLLPMAPEFAEFLEATPVEERTGRVFQPMNRKGTGLSIDSDWVSRVICRIGKAAGVIVNPIGRNGHVKCASAHDLRRSFGERWAPRVMPVVLQELMRHESIETTLKYYVGRNAEATADAIWAGYESKTKACEDRSMHTLMHSRPSGPMPTRRDVSEAL